MRLRVSPIENTGASKNFDRERHGKVRKASLAKNRGNAGEKRHSCRFLNFPKADFRESDKNVASPLIENPRDLTEGKILLFMRIRRRFPLGIFNRR
ncbi:hypothetical protein [Candidatus Spyradosoma sp. SGI.093]|uniref:hypothetical protein n=1 Tax=Candidatus Spyradosoma sp. SGI.093 TaxID=3420583 RepID=UPI003CFD2312